MSKLTTVVCVYNGESFIERCLSSLFNQSYKNLDIIIINDCSTDSTLEKINKLVSGRQNIRVFSNEVNCGLGHSRNYALKFVSTEFVSFLDADDYLDPDYYENMMSILEETKAEIVLSDITLEYHDHSVRSNTSSQDGSISGFIKHWGVASSCNKVISTELLKKFSFGELVCDDIQAIIPVLCHANKIAYCPECTYHYIQSENSLERNIDFPEVRMFIPDVVDVTLDRIKNCSEYLNIEAYCVRNSLIYTLFYTILQISDIDRRVDCLNRFYLKIRKYDLKDNKALREHFDSIPKFEELFYTMLLSTLESGNEEELRKLLARKVNSKYPFVPKVSVIIPVYNGSDYLREAINSALMQTYPNVEVIVVNDGSNDNGDTEQIALSYGERIKYYKKENGGVASAFNYGIKKMTGEYFSWLSHDDIYLPEKLQVQMSEINHSNSYKTVMCSGYSIVNEKGEWMYNMDPFSIHSEGKLNIGLFSVIRGLINGNCLIIHKDYFNEVGLFNEKLPSTQDYDFWFRLLKKAPFKMCKGFLVKSRTHENQGSRTMGEKHQRECTELWKNIIDNFGEENMVLVDGSVYQFYKNSLDFFLNQTPYTGVSKYLKSLFLKEEGRVKQDISKIKVSVVIPIYNRVGLAVKAIESIIKQTHKNLEIIIVDDGSTESTKEIESIAVKDKRIKLFRKENRGVSSARNFGINQATGAYVAFLDSDDLFITEKIEKQLIYMVVNNYNFSHTSYERISIDGKTLEKVNSSIMSGIVYPDIIRCCVIATPTVMFNLHFYKSGKFKFNEAYKIGEDICLWIDISASTKIGALDEAFTKVRVNDLSAANDINKQKIGLTNILHYVVNSQLHSKNEVEITKLLSALNIKFNLTPVSIGGVDQHIIPDFSGRNRFKRIYNKTLYSLRYFGFKITFRKVKNKILDKLLKS